MNGNSHDTKCISVGSRKSQLAMIQTRNVIGMLKERHTQTSYEIKSMSTIGDKILDKALSKIGEKSLFTKELELGLDNKEFDFVVHSLKDLPTTLPDGMVIAAITKRMNPADVVVMHKNHQKLKLGDLPKGSVIGTSSVRRSAQLKRNFPHLAFKNIRGNLNTRLSKLDDHDTYEALIIAAAGIIRMGWSDRISQELKPSECLYAAGQGALAVECRESDLETVQYLSELSDETTLLQCVAERAYLKKLDGGCSAPVGVHTSFSNNTILTLRGAVYSLDGQRTVEKSGSVDLSKINSNNNSKYPLQKFCAVVTTTICNDKMAAAEKLGVDVAMEMIGCGAADILLEAKAQTKNEINKAPNRLPDAVNGNGTIS